MRTKNKYIFLALFVFIIPFTTYSQWYCDNLYGGNIIKLTSNDSAVFALAEGAGVFATYDKGNTWNQILLPNIPFIAAKDSCIFAVINDKLSFSTNSGNTWSLSVIADTGKISSLYTTESGIFVKFVSGKMFLTSCCDQNWHEVSIESSINIVEVSKGLVKITRQSGVFISNNNGETWELIDGTEWTQVNLCIVKQNDNAYIGTDKGVFMVDFVNSSLIQLNTNPVRDMISFDGKLFTCPWAEGVFSSIDNGTTWVSSNNGLSNIHARFVNYNKNLYLTAYEGVFLYDSNSQTWQNHKNGITGSFYAPSVNNIAFNDSGIYIGSENGFFRASKRDFLWSQTISKNLYMIYSIKNILYGLTKNDGIYSSTDNGQNWIETNYGLPEYFYEIRFYPTTILLFEHKDTLFLATNNGLYKSAINIINWKKTQFDDKLDVNSYCISNDEIYIGTTNNGIYSSSDMGTSWKQSNFGIQETYIASLVSNGNYILAGTDKNLYYSDNKGANWTVMENGLPNKQIVTSIYLTDSIIYAATLSNGLWKLTNPSKLNSIIESKMAEVNFYPNPCSLNITFKLYIPNNINHAYLYIYDTFGKLVQTEFLKNRGLINQTVNLSKIASGFYYCQVVFDGAKVYYNKIIKN